MASPTATRVLEHIRSLAAAHGGTPLTDGQLLERFAARREEDAFAALVRRHGPMVLRLCRRFVFNEQDAEDVFQAVFLTLARKAGSVRKRESVASWLHGVAYRLALKARTGAWKRRSRPAPSATRETADPLDELTGRDLCAVLDEELRRLPEKYRAPLVLCHLEGQTQDEAARRLGCPLGTLRSRLDRGRELLRTRLARRGLALSAVLLAGTLSPGAASALPPFVAASTVKAALRFASGGAGAAGLVSARAAALADSICRAVTAARLSAWAALVLAVGALLGGVLWAARAPRAAPGPEPRAGGPAPQVKSDVSAKRTAKARVDLYGDPLPPGALARLGTVRFRSGYLIYKVAFAPDGKTLVASAAGRPTCLYDAATGKVLREFGTQTHILSFAISPDGKTVALADSSIRLFSLATGKQVGELSTPGGFGGSALCVAFSPDGKTLASGAHDNLVRVWDVARAKELHRCTGHEGSVWSVAFTRDGKTLASGSLDNTVRLWDPATGKPRRTLTGHKGYVMSVAVTPDGKTLASASEDKTIRLWETATGKPIRVLQGHEGGVRAVAFSPDGKLLASGGKDRTIRLWRTATGREIRRLSEVLNWAVDAVAFSPDGKTLASGGTWDSTVHLWDVATGKPCRQFGGHTGYISVLAFGADGRSLLSAGRDRTIRVWDVATARERRHVNKPNEGKLDAIAFSPDRKTFVVGEGGRRDHCVWLWDLATGRPLRHLGQHRDWVRAVAFSPDGRVVASSGADPEIRLWDVATGKQLHALQGHQGWVVGLVFSPGGKMLASAVTRIGGGVDNHAVRLWDVATGKEVRGLETTDAGALAFSADGKLLAAGDMGNTIRLWEVATGKEIAQLHRVPRPRVPFVNYLAFSPDGRTLASGWEDRPVILWDVTTRKELRRLWGHESSSGPVLFAPDGRTLVSASGDSSILIWDLTGHIRDGRLDRLSLSPQELAARWADLADPDPEKAEQAVWDLVAAAGQSMPFLKQQVRPAVPVAPRQAKRLIADLDSERFIVRRRATRALERLGERAEAALRRRLAANPSLETRRRIDRLLKKINATTGERLRAVRALTVLERAGGRHAQAVLAELARGEPGMWLTREAGAALTRCRARPGEGSR
jgi:RNA polymerase sigma factor (sigma-70 family)